MPKFNLALENDELPAQGRSSMPANRNNAFNALPEVNAPVNPRLSNRPVNVHQNVPAQGGGVNNVQPHVVANPPQVNGERPQVVANPQDGNVVQRQNAEVGQIGGNLDPQVIGGANPIPAVEGNGQPVHDNLQPNERVENDNPVQDGNANPIQDGNANPVQDGNANPVQQLAQDGNANANNANPQPAPQGANQVDPEAKKRRMAMLKSKFVLKHEVDKNDDEMKSLDNPDVPKSKRLRNNGLMDKGAMAVGMGSLATIPQVLGTVGELGAGMGLLGDPNKAGSLGSKLIDWNQSESTQNMMNTMSAVGGGFMAAGGLASYFANRHRAKHDRNSAHREVAKLRQKANAFTAVRGVASMTGSLNNLGTFGGKPIEHSGQTRLGGVTDLLSSGSAFFAKYYTWKASKTKKKLHKDTSNRTKALRDTVTAKPNPNDPRSQDIADITINGLNDQIRAKKAQGIDANADDLKQLRSDRHTMKAKKYAMDMATRIHDRKSRGKSKDVTGLIGAGISFAGGALSFLSKTGLGRSLGPLATAAGALSGIGGGVGAFLGDQIIDRGTGIRRGRKLAADQRQIAREYIDKKVEKIKNEARALGEAGLSRHERAELGERGTELTDKEARKIAVMRLGEKAKMNKTWGQLFTFSESSDDADLDDKTYDKVFQILVRKRANNIMQSEDRERGRMLTALGLDQDASYEDVVAAINPADDL